jgi:hypothetical protein
MVRQPVLPTYESRVGEFGYLMSFSALRRYDSRPRFPEELKE